MRMMKVMVLASFMCLTACGQGPRCSPPPPPTDELVGTLLSDTCNPGTIPGVMFLFSEADLGCTRSRTSTSADSCSIRRDLVCPGAGTWTLTATATDPEWHKFRESISQGPCRETAEFVGIYK